MSKKRNGDGQKVYFIEAVGLDLVKIGFARDVAQRLTDLQCGSPVALRLLGTIPGGLGMELFFHKDLAEYRVRGEWFALSDRLKKYIANADRLIPHPPEVQAAIDKSVAHYKRRRIATARRASQKNQAGSALWGTVPRAF